MIFFYPFSLLSLKYFNIRIYLGCQYHVANLPGNVKEIEPIGWLKIVIIDHENCPVLILYQLINMSLHEISNYYTVLLFFPAFSLATIRSAMIAVLLGF